MNLHWLSTSTESIDNVPLCKILLGTHLNLYLLSCGITQPGGIRNARSLFDFIGDRMKNNQPQVVIKTRCLFDFIDDRMENTQPPVMRNTRCSFDFISLGEKLIQREGQLVDET